MVRVPRIPWTWTVVGGICVWLVAICCFLVTEQGPEAFGAPDPAVLRTDAARAVHRQDPAAFQRLFAPGTAGSGYAEHYFTELFAVPATRLRLDLETYDDLRFLVLRGRPADGGALCDAWSVQDSGGRSVLSAVPAVTDPCAAGS
ncbi:hypothetical protein [Streptomyces justiciae]|uniref:hypothetical protein n=1 Tax=Streptomyces justiciae TaxID=2780140 RepID=UPI00187F104C|nr:hypothetical protein [Streptomyces justiciae]MBE8478071.1 hypothetical protein [Streptomyces justiciae]MCW8383756.1 hypothetical protein [Streptomyces justiciae]